MAELSCRSNPGLFNKALRVVKDIVSAERRDWLGLQLRAMNPRSLSRADIDTLEAIIGDN